MEQPLSVFLVSFQSKMPLVNCLEAMMVEKVSLQELLSVTIGNLGKRAFQNTAVMATLKIMNNEKF